MTKSTHRVEVVPVKLEPHPNADSLSIVRVYAYSCVVRTEDWRGVDQGAYIVPDSIVPDTDQFKFLGDNKRIKVRRFRGVLSQGLLVPAPEGSKLGDDVSEQLGVTRYEPTMNLTQAGKLGTDCGTHPQGYYPVYDLESWHRYGNLLIPGEKVLITEKLHGANARYVCALDGEMFAGSHKQWKKPDDNCLWWKVFKHNPWIEKFCMDLKGTCLYGEIYGQVQDLKYGSSPGEAWFRVFDILSETGEWLSPAARDFLVYKNNRVPELYIGPYDPEIVHDFSVGKSVLADHLKEGIVIEPVNIRFDDEIGRVKLKLVSDEYLERGK